MGHHRILLFLSWLSLVFKLVAAQSFSWQFTEDVGLNLPQCGSLGVTIKLTTSSPATKLSYYMVALAASGTPTTSLIGQGGGNLQWIVNQPAGSKLLLYVVDSNGQNAPTAPSFFTVSDSQSSNCLSPSTSSTFTVAGNATNEIQTCDSWSLAIRGGSSPYQVTLVALASPSVTNVTMNGGDNVYTYVNRAAPKSILLAAISDSTGKWATGTPFVTTDGASDTSCSGKESTSSHVDLPAVSVTTSAMSSPTSSGPTSSSSTQPSTAKHASKTPVIIGVVVGVLGALLLAVLILWLLRRKQNSQSNHQAPSDVREAVNPFPVTAERIGMVPVRSPKSTAATATSPTSLAPSESTSQLLNSEPDSSLQPSTSMTPLRKPQAYADQTMPADTIQDDGPEVVVQHKDSRRLNIRELPPAYGTQTDA